MLAWVVKRAAGRNPSARLHHLRSVALEYHTTIDFRRETFFDVFKQEGGCVCVRRTVVGVLLGFEHGASALLTCRTVAVIS